MAHRRCTVPSRGYGKDYGDPPSRATLAIIIALLILTGVWLYDGYAEASEAAQAQWNCPVSEWLYEVRDPGMPWWTPDWGEHWYEVE